MSPGRQDVRTSGRQTWPILDHHQPFTTSNHHSSAPPQTACSGARWASRPVRRVLCPRAVTGIGAAAIHLDLPSPAGSSSLPAGIGRAALKRLRWPFPEGTGRLGLAPGGVYRAAPVTRGAGGLLPHRFTLTPGRRTGREAVCFLWHCPAGHPGLPLTTTLPCGARTFLGGALRHRRDRPVDSPIATAMLRRSCPVSGGRAGRRHPG